MNPHGIVFASYASQDASRILPYIEALNGNGIRVWVDSEQLKAGQNWDFEIRKALDQAAIVVIFVSNTSTEKRGYVQRELKIVLEKSEEKLIDDIYFIPVLLDDDVIVPRQLERTQHIKSSDPQSLKKLVDAIQFQFAKIGIATEKAQEESNINWSKTHIHEAKDGAPGYEIGYDLLHLHSQEYKDISQACDIIRGRIIEEASQMRSNLFLPSEYGVNFGHPRYRRIFEYNSHCTEPKFIGRIMSIVYNVYWYGGGAHGSHGYLCFNFVLDPLFKIDTLMSLFKDTDTALAKITTETRKKLADQLNNHTGNADIDWIQRGTSTWDDFSHFSFTSEGLNIYFPPYQVACYADGAPIIQIEYSLLVEHMHAAYASSLDIDHLAYR